MSMSVFPTLSQKPDSKKYSGEKEDPALKNDMEGGYVTARPRFTRRPRRTFRIGYTELPAPDYQLLEDFWDEVRGGSVKFEWLNHLTGETVVVRFVQYWKPSLVKHGIHTAYNVNEIVLQED